MSGLELIAAVFIYGFVNFVGCFSGNCTPVHAPYAVPEPVPKRSSAVFLWEMHAVQYSAAESLDS